MNKVEILLKEHGPMLSGDLSRLYEKRYNVSNEAARKAISRARSPVQRISLFKFEKNQLFYYLESQFMSSKYTDSLLTAIKEHSKTTHMFIQAFIAQSGYVSHKILPAFVGSPIGKVKGHRIYSKLLQNLIDAQIIVDADEEMYSINQTFYSVANINHSKGLEIAKKIIINDFDKWARDVNLVAYEKGKGLFDAPGFGQFQWGYTAPSYIQPMYSAKSNKPGFIIADVFFGKTATKDSIRFFINKLNVIRSFKNISPFMPVLLVDRIDQEALMLLKEHKVMVAILNNLFSEKYTELLNDLVNVFTNATSIINKNPDQIYRLFKVLAKSEGRYNNMAGDLFELLVGSHFSHVGCSYLKSKKIIHNLEQGRSKELDWLIQKDGKTIVVECKATRSKLDEDFVKKWLNENIPYTRKWLLSNEYRERMEFQLWSVGGFTDEALRLLENAEATNRKYVIKHFDYNEMMALAKENNDAHFIDIMTTHFTWP